MLNVQTATLEEITDLLWREDSYSRLPALLELYAPLALNGRSSDWFRLLGKQWSGFDNVGVYRDELFDTLLYAVALNGGPAIEMMDERERAEFADLPDVVTVYRGAGKANRHGISWSLAESVARKFPTLLRYWQKVPMLYTAEVRKQDIIALKLDRDEQEVITFGARIVASRRLPKRNQQQSQATK